jgi:hypothetical protein
VRKTKSLAKDVVRVRICRQGKGNNIFINTGMKKCKCCGKQIEETQILAADACLWCFEHCLASHEEPEQSLERVWRDDDIDI